MSQEAQGCVGKAPFLLSSILRIGPQNEISGSWIAFAGMSFGEVSVIP